MTMEPSMKEKHVKRSFNCEIISENSETEKLGNVFFRK